MKIVVHRGSNQIGGTCIEVSSGNSRLIFDAGLPLNPDHCAGPLHPQVSGLFDDDGPPVDALFLSHAHADHSGLISASRSAVRVGVTEGTSKMLLAGVLFARQPDVPRDRQRILTYGRTVRIGAVKVTALPVDHSVYGAAAFLIEADGKRVLYTGDLRFHGRKPGMARELADCVTKPALDALIIEGTRLGARATEENVTEADLEKQLAADLKDAPGIVLAMYSPLNVDRFVTFYRAAKRARRTFVIDPYQAFVAHLIHQQTKVPTPARAADLRVLIPPGFRTSRAGRRLASKPWYLSLPKFAVSRDTIRAAPERFVVLFRPTMMSWLCPEGLFPNAMSIFSYWPGYLRDPAMVAYTEQVENSDGVLLQRHASGHAHPDDLRQFVEQVKPKVLIPVHTIYPEDWRQIYPNTRVLADRLPLPIQ